jgi:hypothetical protein
MRLLEQPVKDTVKEWEMIAAEEYKFDGVADGWDSDTGEQETPEDKYIKVTAPAQSDMAPAGCMHDSKRTTLAKAGDLVCTHLLCVI